MVVQPELAFIAHPDSLVGPARNQHRRVFLNQAGQHQFFNQVFGFFDPKSLEFTLVGVISRGAKGAAFTQKQINQAAPPDLARPTRNQGQTTQDMGGNFIG